MCKKKKFGLQLYWSVPNHYFLWYKIHENIDKAPPAKFVLKARRTPTPRLPLGADESSCPIFKARLLLESPLENTKSKAFVRSTIAVGTCWTQFRGPCSQMPCLYSCPLQLFWLHWQVSDGSFQFSDKSLYPTESALATLMTKTCFLK